MRYLFMLASLINLTHVGAQINNSGFEEWELIKCCGQPYENPVGWITNNDNLPFGFANTPVTKGIDSSGFYTRIESNYNGIDAYLPGILSQTIPTDHLIKIDYWSKCDSIFQSGRCVVSILGQDSSEILYTDSITEEATGFHLTSINMLNEWIQENDSITIQFVAKGNLDNWDKEEDGYSIFLVDNVTAEYITGTNDVSENIEMKIYPNPSTGIINFIHHQSNDPTIIEIFTLMGEPILKTYNSKKLDLSWLSNGAYCIKLISDKNSISKIFLIGK